MLYFMTISIIIVMTFLVIDLISKKDSDRDLKKINNLILNVLKNENENDLNVEAIKENIINTCKEQGIVIHDLICTIKDNKLNVIYSYKNLNRLSTNSIEVLI